MFVVGQSPERPVAEMFGIAHALNSGCRKRLFPVAFKRISFISRDCGEIIVKGHGQFD